MAGPVSSEGRDWLQLRCNALRPDTTGATGIFLVRTGDRYIRGTTRDTHHPSRVGWIFSCGLPPPAQMTPWKWLPCNTVHWPRVHDAICTEMPRHLQSSSSRAPLDPRYHSFLSDGLQVSHWLGSPSWVTQHTSSQVSSSVQGACLLFAKWAIKSCKKNQSGKTFLSKSRVLSLVLPWR